MEDYRGLYAERDTDNFTYKIQRDLNADAILETSLFFDLINSTLDFVIASEDYCIGNSMMGFDLYDLYTGRVFPVTFKDCADYMRGNVITLHGHLPSEDEMEAMIEFDPYMFPNKECFEIVK